MNIKLRKLLCSTLLQSYFDFGFNVYYRGLKKDIKIKFQTAQNKIVRFILYYDSQGHLDVKDFTKVGYMSVERRYDYLTLNNMFKIYNNVAPSYLCNFKKVEDTHSHSTRGSRMSYVIPHVKNQGSLSFMFNGAKLWNSLPVSIKSNRTIDGFKKKCRDYIFGEMEKSENSDFVYHI